MARQSEMIRLRLSLLVPNRIEQEVDKNILGHLALNVQYSMHIYIFIRFIFLLLLLIYLILLHCKIILCWCKVYAAALSYKSSAENSNV